MEVEIMKADVRNIRETSKSIERYRKDDKFVREFAAIDLDAGNDRISARFYRTKSSSYCCLWVMGKDHYGRGYGLADGHGYHKDSAALGCAIRDADIALSDPIDGYGDGAIREAIKAIADAIGVERCYVHEAHA